MDILRGRLFLYIKPSSQKCKHWGGIYRETRNEDVITTIDKSKCTWVGHVDSQENWGWIKDVIIWRPRLHWTIVERQQRRWIYDVKDKAGKRCCPQVQDRRDWRRKRETYFQEWPVVEEKKVSWMWWSFSFIFKKQLRNSDNYLNKNY